LFYPVDVDFIIPRPVAFVTGGSVYGWLSHHCHLSWSKCSIQSRNRLTCSMNRCGGRTACSLT